MRGLSSTAGGWENRRAAFSWWSQADRPKNQRQQTWTNVAQRNSRREREQLIGSRQTRL